MDKYTLGTQFNTITSPDEIIFAKKEKQLQLPLCKKTTVTEISEDYILPDYLPDIRRLISVNVQTPSPARYIGGDIAQLSGNAVFRVIYADRAGEIYCAVIDFPYEFSEEITLDDRITKNSEFQIFDEVKADNVSTKVTSPRKMSLRCKLYHNICVLGEFDTEIEKFGEVNESSIKKLEHTLQSCRAMRTHDDTVELEESFEIADNARAVALYGSCCIDETVQSQGEITCSGSVALKIALCRENEETVFIEKSFPFTSHPEAFLDLEPYELCAYGKISDVSIETNESTAVCKIRLCVECEAQKNVPALFCTDIFSTENECEIEKKDYSVPYSVFCGNISLTHESSSAIDGILDSASIADVCCSAQCRDVSFENGYCVLNGICKYTLIFNGNSEYSSRSLEFPFNTRICKSDSAPSSFFGDASARSCRVKKEGENFVFTSELVCALRICSENLVSAVDEADFLEAKSQSSSAYKIVYPSPSETLWDISKRYFADPATIAKENGIKAVSPGNANSLNGIKYLII